MSLLTFAHLFTDSKLSDLRINLRDQTDGIVLLLYEVKQIQMLSACEESLCTELYKLCWLILLDHVFTNNTVEPFLNPFCAVQHIFHIWRKSADSVWQCGSSITVWTLLFLLFFRSWQNYYELSKSFQRFEVMATVWILCSFNLIRNVQSDFKNSWDGWIDR